jgi:tRNA(Ile)-lysidine synthase
MLSELQKHIQSESLLPSGALVLIAVSGGADSIFLMHVLHRLQSRLDLRLHVVHLNHGLRGAESDADADFVVAQATALGLAVSVSRSNVRLRAKRSGMSLEMAGRDARYAFFVRVARRLRREQSLTNEQLAVVTAHTINDQAETLLLKLGRGAGRAGLSGIAPRRNHKGVAIVRPLLKVTRERLERWLVRQGVVWREDPSNQDDDFLRNRVRHEVLPLLANRLNPQIVGTLARTATILSGEETWMNTLAEAMLRKVGRAQGGLCVSDMRTLPSPARLRVLRLWLSREGFPVEMADFALFERLDALLSRRASGSTCIDLSQGWRAERRYSVLVLLRPGAREKVIQRARYRLARHGSTDLPMLGLRAEVLVGQQIRRDATRQPGKMPARASFSAERIGRASLYLRHWKNGDRMRPLKSRGSQKLQDIFVNLKVPKSQRGTVPVLECRGEIIWIPGFRIAEGWQVRSTDALPVEVRLRRPGKVAETTISP